MRILIAVMMIAGLLAPVAVASERDWAAVQLDEALGAYRLRDFETARRGFKRLANQGSAIGETMLGIMYSEGNGVAQSPTNAAAYFYRAASRGYGPAEIALSDAYLVGRGVPANDSEAYFWALAATQGGDRSAERQGRARLEHLRKYLDARKRAKIERRFEEWRPRAVRQR